MPSLLNWFQFYSPRKITNMKPVIPYTYTVDPSTISLSQVHLMGFPSCSQTCRLTLYNKPHAAFSFPASSEKGTCARTRTGGAGTAEL